MHDNVRPAATSEAMPLDPMSAFRDDGRLIVSLILIYDSFNDELIFISNNFFRKKNMIRENSRGRRIRVMHAITSQTQGDNSVYHQCYMGNYFYTIHQQIIGIHVDS